MEAWNSLGRSREGQGHGSAVGAVLVNMRDGRHGVLSLMVFESGENCEETSPRRFQAYRKLLRHSRSQQRSINRNAIHQTFNITEPSRLGNTLSYIKTSCGWNVNALLNRLNYVFCISCYRNRNTKYEFRISYLFPTGESHIPKALLLRKTDKGRGRCFLPCAVRPAAWRARFSSSRKVGNRL